MCYMCFLFNLRSMHITVDTIYQYTLTYTLFHAWWNISAISAKGCPINTYCSKWLFKNTDDEFIMYPITDFISQNICLECRTVFTNGKLSSRRFFLVPKCPSKWQRKTVRWSFCYLCFKSCKYNQNNQFRYETISNMVEEISIFLPFTLRLKPLVVDN